MNARHEEVELISRKKTTASFCPRASCKLAVRPARREAKKASFSPYGKASSTPGESSGSGATPVLPARYGAAGMVVARGTGLDETGYDGRERVDMTEQEIRELAVRLDGLAEKVRQVDVLARRLLAAHDSVTPSGICDSPSGR